MRIVTASFAKHHSIHPVNVCLVEHIFFSQSLWVIIWSIWGRTIWVRQSTVDSNWAIHRLRERRMGSPPRPRKPLFEPRGARQSLQEKGPADRRPDTESTIIIHDCQSEIFSNVWSQGWIINCRLDFCFRLGFEVVRWSAIWRKMESANTRGKGGLKMKREGTSS